MQSSDSDRHQQTLNGPLAKALPIYPTSYNLSNPFNENECSLYSYLKIHVSDAPPAYLPSNIFAIVLVKFCTLPLLAFATVQQH